jgi:hypothetical protein
LAENESTTTPPDSTAVREPAGHRVRATVELLAGAALREDDIERLISRGTQDEVSTRILDTSFEPLDGQRLALLAIAHHSDPAFFGVDIHGRALDDDENPPADPVKGSVHNLAEPATVIALLEQRGCRTLDRRALSAAVGANPGPVYHDGRDRDELGHTWAERGEPWLQALETALIGQRAISPPTGKHTRAGRRLRKRVLARLGAVGRTLARALRGLLTALARGRQRHTGSTRRPGPRLDATYYAPIAVALPRLDQSTDQLGLRLSAASGAVIVEPATGRLSTTSRARSDSRTSSRSPIVS